MRQKLLSFIGGIHPEQNKLFTQNKPIERCDVLSTVIIPLAQHIGAPCEPLVKRGDKVLLGQKIGQPKGFVSAPVHSSVSGTVKAVEQYHHPSGEKVLSVIIENDGLDTIDETLKAAADNASPKELLNIILEAGIVGMGGAAFPTHVKLSPPPEKKIDTIILNGAECEPYLTSDYRLMVDKPQEIIDGLEIIMKIINVQNGFIGIEDNKPDAYNAVLKAAENKKGIKVVLLKTKYPQGAEKQLIFSVTKRQVPSGGLPMDAGVVVVNVGTSAAISRAVRTGMPLFERIVTVSGDAVNTPKNLLVRIGTPFKDVIEFCGGYKEEPKKVLSGGPMMGTAQHTLDVPVIKGTSGILLLSSKKAEISNPMPCIRCGRCLEACPINLVPLTLSANSLHQNFEACEKLHAMDCIECGCCSFVCPSARPLTQSIRVAKREIVAARKRSAKA